MSDRESLAKIGIKDESFEFLTVAQLVKRGIIEKPLDGNHGEIHPKGEDFVASGIPFIMASDINDGVVDYSGCKFVTRKQADSLRKGFARNGDVLLTHKATIGRTAIVRYDDQPYVMLTPQVTYYRVSDHKKLNHRYLRYYFESSFFQDILSLWAGSGSTRAYLGITEQGKLPFVLPPINKQQKIAAALTSFDELIENNRRRIVLLEMMAEEIYREWFVRLRFPGHEKVKVIKGMPEGWEQKFLPEIANITYGFAFDGSRFNTEGRGKPIIRIRNIPESVTTDYTDEVANEKYIVRHGDLLVGMDGEFHINHWQGEEAYLVQRVCRIKAKNPMLSSYLAHAIRAPIKHFESILMGATVGHLGAMHLKGISLLVPPEHVQKRLHALNDIHRQILQISIATRALLRTRDVLLPRLISGKLSVENLDIQFPPSMEDHAHEV
jgi:type I restriction enzyme S subunit